MKTFPSTVKQGSMFSPRDRELSAKRHAIKRLENSLTETKRELNDLKKENRLLNRLQIRQEKEINRFQTQEGELPEILARHTEEVSNGFYDKTNQARYCAKRYQVTKTKLVESSTFAVRIGKLHVASP